MPTYDFINNDTGEEFTFMMSISSMEALLKEHPHITQVHNRVAGIVSGVNHQNKIDGGMKENLQRIAEAHPNSALADKVLKRSVKEVKVRELAKKHGFNKNGNEKLPFKEEKYFYDQQK